MLHIWHENFLWFIVLAKATLGFSGTKFNYSDMISIFSVGTAVRKLFIVVAGTHIIAVKSAKCNIGRNTTPSMINISQATHLNNHNPSHLPPHQGHQVLIPPQGAEEVPSTFPWQQRPQPLEWHQLQEVPVDLSPRHILQLQQPHLRLIKCFL